MHIVNTRIRGIPDIAHLDNLETLNMHGCGVSTLDRPLPSSLRTLVLDHNCLRTIDYAVLPAELACISVAYNPLLTLGACPAKWQSSLFDAACSGETARVRLNGLRGETARVRLNGAQTLYDNSQNVHDSTIQQSVIASIGVLFGTRANRREPDFLMLLKARLSARPRRRTCRIFRVFMVLLGIESRDEFGFLDAWVQCETTIGTSGRTIGSLLERAYVVASMHEASDELFARLAQELSDAEHVCFTGKVSRVVNAFAGFVEGVDVRVSERAELHARVGIALDKKRRAKDAPEKERLLVEFLAIVSGHCDMSEEEFDAWLEAYADAP